MKHNHPPILLLVITILLVGLSIAGGPIVFVLAVMAAPLILLMVLSARAVVRGSSGITHNGDLRRDTRPDSGAERDKTYLEL